MSRSRATIVLVAFALALAAAAIVPATAQRVDRTGPKPPPPAKYKISDGVLRRSGIAHGAMPAFPNKCYDDVSISDELLASFRTRGFSTEAACLAITSPWVQYHPETGKPLRVTEDFLLDVPECFKNGTPFLDCRFVFDHSSGLRLAGSEPQKTHARAAAVDAAVRGLVAGGRYASVCRCEDLRWDRARTRFSAAGACRIDTAPACLEQMSGRTYRAGALVTEIDGIAFDGVPTKGFTDYGGFDISPRLARGYAYRIGSPEGDDDTPYAELPPGQLITIGVQ